MIFTTKNGKEVEVKVSGRYDDDIQIYSATYLDSEEEVDQDVLDELYDENVDAIYEEWQEQQRGASDWLYDMYKEEGRYD